MTTALIWPLLVLSGVGVGQAGRVALVIALQAFSGALLWRLARGSVAVYFAELLGAGLALGTLLSLLAQQVLRVTPLATQAWWLPAALVVLLVVGLHATPRTRRRLALAQDCPLGIGEVGGILVGLVVGMVYVGAFWRAHPLSWNGWWAYYVDIPYHEALARSVTTWGPWDNILAVGSPVRYHWFADAWSGTTSNASSAAPFVVMTRALPLVALIGTVCLVWAWARRLSDLRAVPVLAVLLTTVATDVATAHQTEYLHMFTMSPSLGLAALWLIGAALVFTEHVNRRLRWSLAFLVLFAVGCVGGKTSNAAALMGGVGLAAVAAVWLPAVRIRVWSAFAVVAAAVGGAYVVLIMGSAGNLTVQLGATAKNYGLLPAMTWWGVIVGTLAAGLVFASKWVGVSLLAADRTTSRLPDVWFAVGAALTGLFLMAVLGHPGQSQLYFPVSSGLVVAVVSAWGIGEALRLLSPAVAGASAVIGLVAGGIGLAVAVHPGRLTLLPARVIEIGPYAVWIFALACAVGVALRARMRGVRFPRGGVAAVFSLIMITASVVSGQVAIADIVRAPRPVGTAPDAVHAWSPAQVTALSWLRAHSAQQDVVATNRQCTYGHTLPTPCGSTDFLTAALAGRRMYVEGADYAISQPHPAWIDRRVALSRRFVDTPGAADAGVLWAAGVRWVVVDLASTTTRSWAPYAQPVETTATTEVLRLNAP